MSPLPAVSCVLAICGVPASGKSTLAAAAAARLGWPALSSDLVRKELAGVAAAERAGPAHYTAEFSLAVYAELGARAAACARARGAVIVDGTFRRRGDRAAFTVALDDAAPVLYAECRVPLPVLLARAAARDCQPGQASDATAAVVAAEYDRWQPLDEVTGGHRIALSTDRPLAMSLADLAALVTSAARRGIL